MFARAIDKNNTYEPILYMDEWIRSVALGHMKPSTTDEVPTRGVAKGPAAEQQHIMALKSKNSGKIQTSESLLNAKEAERASLENSVEGKIRDIFSMIHCPDLSRIKILTQICKENFFLML